MPCSFHPFVVPTNQEVKEGRGTFTLLFGHKPTSEGRPRSFHPSALATNREVNPFPLGFGHKPRGEGRPRSFMPRFWLQTER